MQATLPWSLCFSGFTTIFQVVRSSRMSQRLVITLLQLILTGQTIAALFPPSNETTHLAALQACHQLKSSLGSSIVQSSGPEYQATATNAWNLENSKFQPTCVVFPRVTAHVQTAMKTIFVAGSHYAVQAGSHSAMRGWNSVQDGVLILFSHMNNASYDQVTDTITLEPGIHWQEAVAALAPFGVAPVALATLVQDSSWVAAYHTSALLKGYAADNFKALDVVLVNGDLVTATATNEYSDLFRALKGGGNRFGIVTRYELIPAHTGTENDKNFFGGLLMYNSSAEALLKATAKYVREVNDPNAVLLVALNNVIVGRELIPSYIAVMFYRGSELPMDIFGDFLAIPTISSSLSSPLGPKSYVDVMATLGLESERGFVQRFGASALDGNEVDKFLDAFNHWTNFTMSFTDVFNLTTLAFTPIPESQVQAGRNKGGNIINPSRGGFAAVQLAEQFNAGIEDVSPAVQNGIDLLFEQIPPSSGLPLYLNECDAGQEVFESYGDFELLKQIYAKYDPTRFNVEHLRGPGGL
ncbi:FAD-binding protein [Mycena sanguinolenta]|uniref:FAD-binding protein n=1 Tax=Mycena sanguinolenta TaxID=230812 RepID=A0A8H6YDE8_9AGAR|nr:FAD-binding protein [Mycena sanguinolenta]